MKISEASRARGVSARSLRHYEDEGLIVPRPFQQWVPRLLPVHD
ncbi:MerR family DNA-binding transcriptional regulator [Micromonospora sp. NPDC000663]